MRAPPLLLGRMQEGRERAVDRILAGYRERLAEIDERLVALHVRRRALVRELFEIKDRHGLPRLDRAQEERVVARARRLSLEQGGDPEEVARLFRWLLEDGRAQGLPGPGHGSPGAPVPVALPPPESGGVRRVRGGPSRVPPAVSGTGAPD